MLAAGGGQNAGDERPGSQSQQLPASPFPASAPPQEPPFTQEENFKSDDIPF